MFRFLLPAEVGFFEYFDQHIALTVKVAEELVALTGDGRDLEAYAGRIHDLEHQTDEVTKQCIIGLHKTFITPIDRGDIHRLMTRLDDITDFADSAVARMALYRLTEMRPEARELADVLLRATRELQIAIGHLRDMKHADVINQHCIKVHELENEGDAILAKALARLFNNAEDALLVLKWKEIFESLEKAVDRCQDVAIVIEGLVIEAS